MKKLRLLLCLLIVVCIIASSSTFSAMPQGKFPIRIISSRENPNQYERTLINHLEKAFNNSSKFRVTNNNEDRIILTLLINEYFPGVASSDVLATATPIKTFSLVWATKSKNNHANLLWHDAGNFQTYEQLTQYILKQADTMLSWIKNSYSYLFD
mgnify:CR=1 FL=1|jgi:hypothetical protein